MNIEQLKYPIGRFDFPTVITDAMVAAWIAELEAFPAQFRAEATRLTEAQLDTPYRPDGWTLRQVIQHVPDSHANAYIRVKWALTEDNPTIKAYEEGAWAMLDPHAPIEPALQMLESLHIRLVRLLKSLSSEQLLRTFVHPETKRTIVLREMLALYAWHGQHHLGHLRLV
jgi:hypothetical protein